MDIMPTDLSTYSGEAKNILRDLQSRNERMFLVTFLVVNIADTKQKLENDLLQASSVAQKFNWALTPSNVANIGAIDDFYDLYVSIQELVPVCIAVGV